MWEKFLEEVILPGGRIDEPHLAERTRGVISESCGKSAYWEPSKPF